MNICFLLNLLKNSHSVSDLPAVFASCANQHHLVVIYLHDVKDILQVYDLPTGQLVMDVPLDMGTVTAMLCKKNCPGIMYKVTSFTRPSNTNELFKLVELLSKIQTTIMK